MPLSTSIKLAGEVKVPYRLYKPDKGESWADLRKRCETFLKMVADKYIFNTKVKEEFKHELHDFPKILAVTHKGFICEFLEMYKKISGDGSNALGLPKNTAIYIFAIECANCQGVCECVKPNMQMKLVVSNLSLIHICRCRRLLTCRSRWSPYH
eukprot:TRINITY_DN7967_c0_g1_i1.p1 TRINITY_DN7967_c0_g1~~TRINITY_DN7967_c0_g1_i1.p1  ORF type:complete len:154 (+),score=14.53 TRINITY_DN7967_c0_g1_i1:469-930(+)